MLQLTGSCSSKVLQSDEECSVPCVRVKEEKPPLGLVIFLTSVEGGLSETRSFFSRFITKLIFVCCLDFLWFYTHMYHIPHHVLILWLVIQHTSIFWNCCFSIHSCYLFHSCNKCILFLWTVSSIVSLMILLKNVWFSLKTCSSWKDSCGFLNERLACVKQLQVIVIIISGENASC